MLKQLTFAQQSHQLTNAQVWSPDSQQIVYDCRRHQSKFDNTLIETIDIYNGRINRLYESTEGAHVGVVTAHPLKPNEYIFIHGPHKPDDRWHYDFHYRRGVILSLDDTLAISLINFDGFYENQPWIPGVLHGGTHVHLFSPDGTKVSFTYDDYLLNTHNKENAKRNVGVGFKCKDVYFVPTHKRQYVGTYYCTLISQTVARATWGSDEIEKAYEECWIGLKGYSLSNQQHQRWAVAFMGDLRDKSGDLYTEIFIVNLPDDTDKWQLSQSLYNQLKTNETYQLPPVSPYIQQKRLTFTQHRKYKGLCTQTRHWLRSSPCGRYIACLMKDDAGITQLWLVLTNNGELIQLTNSTTPMCSAFTWHPSGLGIVIVSDDTIQFARLADRQLIALSEKLSPPPNPEAVVCSPDGKWVTFTRDIPENNDAFRQIFLLAIAPEYLA